MEVAKVRLAASGQGQHLLSFTFSFPFSGFPIHLFTFFITVISYTNHHNPLLTMINGYIITMDVQC